MFVKMFFPEKVSENDIYFKMWVLGFSSHIRIVYLLHVYIYILVSDPSTRRNNQRPLVSHLMNTEGRKDSPLAAYWSDIYIESKFLKVKTSS